MFRVKKPDCMTYLQRRPAILRRPATLLDKACSLENFYPLNSKNCGGDPVIFSANVYTHCSTFTERQVLLDTCAAESVFFCRDFFYSIMPSATPMIINGVNHQEEPLIITECGETDFGTVSFDSTCIANISSLVA